MNRIDPQVHQVLKRGIVIPASPLALTARRKLDESRQRALFRYYIAAGVGGLAVGVHTTQFAIHNPKVGLFEPVLALAAAEMGQTDAERLEPLVRIGGICGPTSQAIAEATLLRRLGYHAGLLNLAALKNADDRALLDHCRAVAEVVPLFGFYLQPAIGGRVLSADFWQHFVQIENVAAIKVAPFNRYQTLDVLRAVAASGREDIALYTGNDDHIVLDLLTAYRHAGLDNTVTIRIVGGLLGQWAVWTRRAVELLEECHTVVRDWLAIPFNLMRRSTELTDVNAAIFDAAHDYAGCIPGIHEVLRRQGLLKGIWCLNERQTLSPGQAEAIDRVYRAYPHLNDDAFVAEHLDEWLRP